MWFMVALLRANHKPIRKQIGSGEVYESNLKKKGFKKGLKEENGKGSIR
jgi:hypothetical protein